MTLRNEFLDTHMRR